MCFAYSIYVWAVRTAPSEHLVLEGAVEADRHEPEIIDLIPYLSAQAEPVEEFRRAA